MLRVRTQLEFMTAPQHHRLRWLVFLLLAVFPGCTCANAEYRKAYAEVVDREVNAYRHQGDEDALRADVAGFMVDQGYVPTPARGAKLESEWRVQGDVRDRLRATFIPARGGLTIHVHVEDQALSPPKWAPVSNERRPDLERAVLQAVDPEQAEALEPGVGTKGLTLTAPPAEIWEAMMHAALEESHVGYGYDPILDVNTPSMWKEDFDAGERRRLEVRLARAGAEGHSLVIRERVEKIVGERKWLPGRDERSQDLELALISHRDPVEGERIVREADQAGQKAFDEAVDNGALVAPSCHCH